MLVYQRVCELDKTDEIGRPKYQNPLELDDNWIQMMNIIQSTCRKSAMFSRDSDGMLIKLSQALLNYDTLDAETKSLVDERMKGYKDPQESIPLDQDFTTVELKRKRSFCCDMIG